MHPAVLDFLHSCICWIVLSRLTVLPTRFWLLADIGVPLLFHLLGPQESPPNTHVPVCHTLLQPCLRSDTQEKRPVAAAVLHELLCLGDIAAHGHSSSLEPLELSNALCTCTALVFSPLEGLLHLGIAFFQECSKALCIRLQGLVAAFEGFSALLGVLFLSCKYVQRRDGGRNCRRTSLHISASRFSSVICTKNISLLREMNSCRFSLRWRRVVVSVGAWWLWAPKLATCDVVYSTCCAERSSLAWRTGLVMASYNEMALGQRSHTRLCT